MRTGLIVRANQKGLGTQTLELARNYPFDSLLLVIDHNRRWPEDPSLFPGAHVAEWHWRDDLRLDPHPVRAFLSEVDVVFSVETLYDPQLAVQARNQEIYTVIQGNPEFYRHSLYRWPHGPDRWTWPTSWLLDLIPPGQVIPVPAMTPGARPGDPDDDILTILHVAGHRAAGDRNGTELFAHGLRTVQHRCKVRIVSQDGEIRLPRLPPHVEVELLPHGVADRWEMYEGVHVLVMPRRYGGLSLPIVEALSVGCAVAATDCPPNHSWPIVPLAAREGRAIRVPVGDVRAHQIQPRSVGRVVDLLTEDRAYLRSLMDQSTQWAVSNSWERLRPVYTSLLTSW